MQRECSLSSVLTGAACGVVSPLPSVTIWSTKVTVNSYREIFFAQVEMYRMYEFKTIDSKMLKKIFLVHFHCNNHASCSQQNLW